jgi:predicted DNA-binding transcriptional regulator YafY
MQLLTTNEAPISVGRLLALQRSASASPTEPVEDHARLDDLRDAVGRRARLKLSYRASGGAVTERLVDSLELIGGYGGDYLVAFCHLRAEKRTFRIDRIAKWEQV